MIKEDNWNKPKIYGEKKTIEYFKHLKLVNHFLILTNDRSTRLTKLKV